MQIPSLDADHGLDAAPFLSQATGDGQRMSASIQQQQKKNQEQHFDLQSRRVVGVRARMPE